MRICADSGCRVKGKQGFKLHKWPRDENLADIWTKKVRKFGFPDDGISDWLPKDSSVLCEKHFDPHQYIDIASKKLKHDAVPTRLTYSKIARKSPRKRVISPPTSPPTPPPPPTPVQDEVPFTPRSQIKREHGYYRTRSTPKKKRKKKPRAILSDHVSAVIPIVEERELGHVGVGVEVDPVPVDDGSIIMSPTMVIDSSFESHCQVMFSQRVYLFIWLIYLACPRKIPIFFDSITSKTSR